MADQQNDQQDFGQRQMYQGNWQCAGCGAEITELPFEPSGDRPIYCRPCHQNMRQNRDSRDQDRRPRQMYQGNWECSGCGAEIKELPFEPNGTQPIYCRDCYMAKRQER